MVLWSNPFIGWRFIFSREFTPALELTQRPVQWVPGLFPGGKAAGSVNLITHIQHVPWLGMSGALICHPYTPSLP